MIRKNTALRNLGLDAIFNSAAGIALANGGTLELRSGAQPATADAALTGTVIATIALPADAMGAAAAGAIALAGVWEDLAADAAGVAGYFTMRDAGGTYRIDGSVTATGGAGDMELDNVNLNAGQRFSITGFQLTDPA